MHRSAARGWLRVIVYARVRLSCRAAAAAAAQYEARQMMARAKATRAAADISNEQRRTSGSSAETYFLHCSHAQMGMLRKLVRHSNGRSGKANERAVLSVTGSLCASVLTRNQLARGFVRVHFELAARVPLLLLLCARQACAFWADLCVR